MWKNGYAAGIVLVLGNLQVRRLGIENRNSLRPRLSDRVVRDTRLLGMCRLHDILLSAMEFTRNHASFSPRRIVIWSGRLAGTDTADELAQTRRENEAFPSTGN